MTNPLFWECAGHGEWQADSCLHDEGIPFVWVIGVCNDGTFDVSKSDSELTDRKDCFPTLAAAKAFCQASENLAISSDS